MGHVHVSQCAYVLEFHFQHCAKQRHKMTAKKRESERLYAYEYSTSPSYSCVPCFCFAPKQTVTECLKEAA